MRDGLDRLERKDKPRDHFVGLGRTNRHRDHFIHRRAASFIAPGEIAGLHRLGDATLRKPCLFVRRELARAAGGWNENRAVAVEKTVEPGVQRIDRVGSARRRLFHQVAQFFAGTRVEQIERVILQRSMNARVLCQRFGTVGDRGVAQILQPMERGELKLEVPLQIGSRVVCRAVARRKCLTTSGPRRPASWPPAVWCESGGCRGCETRRPGSREVHVRRRAALQINRMFPCRLAVDPGLEDMMARRQIR